MSKIGERIKARRKELGISADTIAEKLKVSRSTVFRYENGDIEKLPGESLIQIADLLHTTPNFLMGLEEEQAYIEGIRSAKLLKKYDQLTEANKQAVMNLIDNLLTAQSKS